MTTPLNRIRNVSRTLPLHIVAGHGKLIADMPKVPPDTYIIFLAKPGYQLSASTLFYPELYDAEFLRGVLQGKRTTRIPSLSHWQAHVYGPGNAYPNLVLNTYDTTNKELNNLFGLYSVNTTTTRFHKLHHVLLSHVIGKKTGIFFVISCRVGKRSPVRTAQRHENTQRLRMRGTRTHSAPTVRRTSPVKRRRLNPPVFGNRTFTFAPGVRVLGSQPATQRRTPRKSGR